MGKHTGGVALEGAELSSACAFHAKQDRPHWMPRDHASDVRRGGRFGVEGFLVSDVVCMLS